MAKVMIESKLRHGQPGSELYLTRIDKRQGPMWSTMCVSAATFEQGVEAETVLKIINETHSTNRVARIVPA